MSRVFLASLAGAIVLAGCSGGKSATSSPGSLTVKNDSKADADAGAGSVTPPAPSTPSTPPISPKDLKLPEPNPEAFKTEPTGKGGWVVTKVDGMQLAKKVGEAMGSMNRTVGRTVTTLTTPQGSGQIQSEIKVQDGTRYRIQYPVLSAMPGTSEFVSDGKTKAYKGTKGIIETKRPVEKPGPDAQKKGSELANEWAREFPRLVYRGIVEDSDPWSPLMKALLHPQSGFKTEVAERALMYQGTKRLNYRLVATRKSEAAKRLGPCQIEMIFDGQRYLPVTIKVNYKDPEEGEYKVQWSTGWSFNKTFKPEEFKF